MAPPVSAVRPTTMRSLTGSSRVRRSGLRVSNAAIAVASATRRSPNTWPRRPARRGRQRRGLIERPDQGHFDAQWDFASTCPAPNNPASGRRLSDRGDGARMSWIQMTDTSTGSRRQLHDYRDEHVVGEGLGDDNGRRSPDLFFQTAVASGLAATGPHDQGPIDFLDGEDNDVVRVWVDGDIAPRRYDLGGLLPVLRGRSRPGRSTPCSSAAPEPPLLIPMGFGFLHRQPDDLPSEARRRPTTRTGLVERYSPAAGDHDIDDDHLDGLPGQGPGADQRRRDEQLPEEAWRHPGPVRPRERDPDRRHGPRRRPVPSSSSRSSRTLGQRRRLLVPSASYTRCAEVLFADVNELVADYCLHHGRLRRSARCAGPLQIDADGNGESNGIDARGSTTETSRTSPIAPAPSRKRGYNLIGRSDARYDLTAVRRPVLRHLRRRAGQWSGNTNGPSGPASSSTPVVSTSTTS